MKNHKKPSSSLTTAAKGSALTLIGSFTGKSFSFVLRFLVIQLLGAKYFGFYAICLMLVQFLRILSSIGLPKGGMRFLASALGNNDARRLPQIINTAILIPVLLSILCSVLFFLEADVVANLWFHNPELIPFFRLFAIAIPCVTLLNVGTELSRGFFTTRYAVLVEYFIVPILLMLLFLSFYFWRHDFQALIYAFIIANSMGGVCIIFFLFLQTKRAFIRYEVPEQFHKQWWIHGGLSFEVVSYSFPLFLSGITGILMSSIDIFMLGRFVDADVVGIYAAASMVAVFLSTSLVIPVNSIFAPLVAGHHHGNNLTTIHHLYIATTRWLFFFAIPLVTGVMLFRKEIMAIFGGGFVDDGAKVLLILAVGHLLNCLTGGVGQILSMAGHPKKELAINILIVILNIGLNLLFIPRYGLIGAAYATSIALGLVNILRTVVVYKIFKIQPFTVHLAWIFVISFLLVCGNLLFQTFSPSDYYYLGYALITCIILIWLMVSKGMEPEDKDVLHEVWQRLSDLIANRK